MTYVTGFLAAVPTANKQKFKEHSELAAEVMKEFGALQYMECWGEDVPRGEVTDFYRATNAKDDETIVFSWITWPDRETCDAAHVRMMEDPRMSPEHNPMPFDGKRMMFGGFEVLVSH